MTRRPTGLTNPYHPIWGRIPAMLGNTNNITSVVRVRGEMDGHANARKNLDEATIVMKPFNRSLALGATGQGYLQLLSCISQTINAQTSGIAQKGLRVSKYFTDYILRCDNAFKVVLFYLKLENSTTYSNGPIVPDGAGLMYIQQEITAAVQAGKRFSYSLIGEFNAFKPMATDLYSVAIHTDMTKVADDYAKLAADAEISGDTLPSLYIGAFITCSAVNRTIYCAEMEEFHQYEVNQ